MPANLDTMRQMIGLSHRNSTNGAGSFERPNCKGDLRTLDIVAWARHNGAYVGPLKGEPRAHVVDPCPCGDKHSEDTGERQTIIYERDPDVPSSRPTINCLHAHHGGLGEMTVAKAVNHSTWKDVDRFCEREYGEGGEAPSGEAPRKRFEVFEIGPGRDLKDLRKIKSRRHILRGIAPSHGVMLFCGFKDAGKSTLSLDIVMHYVCGLPWHGHEPSDRIQGAVGWIAGEGLQNTSDVLQGWLLAHPDAQMKRKMFIIAPRLPIQDPEARAALVEEVRAHLDKRGLAILVVDTLNKNFGGNANDTKDMTAFMDGCQELSETFEGSLVWVNCHTGWDQSRPRGSSVAPMDCETTWMLELQSGRTTMEPRWNKGGMTEETLTFEFTRHGATRIEVDEEGVEEEVGFTYPIAVRVEQRRTEEESSTAMRQRLVLEAVVNADGPTSTSGVYAAVMTPYNVHNAEVALADPPGVEWKVPSSRSVERDLDGFLGMDPPLVTRRGSGRNTVYEATPEGVRRVRPLEDLRRTVEAQREEEA